MLHQVQDVRDDLLQALRVSEEQSRKVFTALSTSMIGSEHRL